MSYDAQQEADRAIGELDSTDVSLYVATARIRAAIERAYAAGREETEGKQRCACTLVAPCSPACTCAHPAMSGGCTRCCTYGSEEQRRATAERIVEREVLLLLWEPVVRAACALSGLQTGAGIDQAVRLSCIAVRALPPEARP